MAPSSRLPASAWLPLRGLRLLVAAPALTLALALAGQGPGALAGSRATPPDLTGEWILDASASQSLAWPAAAPGDGERATDPMTPEDSVLPDPPLGPDEMRSSHRARRTPGWLLGTERRKALRTLFGETLTLSVIQTPTYVDLRTETGSRSLEIGAASQISLPTGELADQRVHWQGRRLVVERRVPRGVRIVESFQLLPDTDQLEVSVRRRGGPDDGLGKVNLKRVFDRDPGSTAAACHNRECSMKEAIP